MKGHLSFFRNLSLFVLLIVVFTACIPCKPRVDRQELIFGVGAGSSRLHIFQDDNAASKPNLPQGSQILTIASDTLIGSETIYLKPKTTDIQNIEIRVVYEYHAETTNAPAILEFVLKDSSGTVLWSKKESYTTGQPMTPNQVGETKYDLNIQIPDDLTQLTFEIKPISAGDFGFYISDLKVVVYATYCE